MRKTIVIVSIVVVLVLAALAATGTAFASSTSTTVAASLSAAATPQATTGKAWLGVSVMTVTEQVAKRLSLSQTEGAVVTAVVADSPAAKAGLKRNDVITAVNGTAVKTAKDLTDQVAKRAVGDNVTVSIVRGTEKLTITVTAGEAPAAPGRNSPPGFNFGFDFKFGLGGRLPSLPQDLRDVLKDIPQDQRFDHNLGSTHTFKDKDGNQVTVYTIPGTVTAVSSTSITITPNNPQSPNGPFSIDGTTRIIAGARDSGTDDVAVGDKVIVVVVGNSNHASIVAKVGAREMQRGPMQFFKDRGLRMPNGKFQMPRDVPRWPRGAQPAAPGSGA